MKTVYSRLQVSQSSGPVSSEFSQKLAQSDQKLAQSDQELAQTDQELTQTDDRVEIILEKELPTLRKDARKNAELVLKEIVKNAEVTISMIHEHTGIPEKTIKNAQALLRNVGILYRIGGDFGGHWMISWKDGMASNG